MESDVGFSRRRKKKNVFATWRVAGESQPPDAAVLFLFFLQRVWEMDGAAARPSRTSACVVLAEWAADELFCRDGWNG